MEYRNVPVDSLIPYERNPRRNDQAVDAVAASIREFGFKVPIVVDRDNVVVAGHTRLKAAKRLGLETVPVIVADDLTPDQIKAFRLADNKTAELADWDLDMLDLEMDEIDLDMEQFGFELGGISSEDVQEDEYTIEPPEEPQTKLGDIFQLGNHRLMCGSSNDWTHVMQLLGEDKAPLLFTSPPYSDMRTYRGGKDLDVDKIVQFMDCYKNNTAIMAVNLGIQRKNQEIYRYWDQYIDHANEIGLKLLAWNVWDKMMCGAVGQAKAMVPIRHEWIFCFGEKPIDLNLTWEKKRSSIYDIGRQRTVRQRDGSLKTSSSGVSNKRWKKMESLCKIPEKQALDSVTEQVSETGSIRAKHPATFPVYLPSEYIIAFTEKNDVVVEPFGGSGTTLIACEQLGRKCRCMELDPVYCDVIIDRWETFTGEKAVLLNG